MSCGVGHRHGSDPSLLWLWHRPAAIAPIQSLAWEFPYVTGVALKRPKKKKKRKKERKDSSLSEPCDSGSKPFPSLLPLPSSLGTALAHRHLPLPQSCFTLTCFSNISIFLSLPSPPPIPECCSVYQAPPLGAFSKALQEMISTLSRFPQLPQAPP